MTRTLIVKKGHKEVHLNSDQYVIDRNTGLGENADYYEVKPHGGRKWIRPNDILGYIIDNKET